MSLYVSSDIPRPEHPNPQFEGQTKTKLGNTEVRRIVSQAMSDKFEAYLLENPAVAKIIVEKSILALRARIAAKKAMEAENFGDYKIKKVKNS